MQGLLSRVGNRREEVGVVGPSLLTFVTQPTGKYCLLPGHPPPYRHWWVCLSTVITCSSQRGLTSSVAKARNIRILLPQDKHCQHWGVSFGLFCVCPGVLFL